MNSINLGTKREWFFYIKNRTILWYLKHLLNKHFESKKILKISAFNYQETDNFYRSTVKLINLLKKVEAKKLFNKNEYELFINDFISRSSSIDWVLSYLVRKEFKKECVEENEKVPRAFIKNVAIRVDKDYEFDNSPFHQKSKKKAEKTFIGREGIQAKFLQFLIRAKDDNKSGVYLVTGYRGMGKTSFVNRVIQKYIIERHKSNRKVSVIPITISLAQKQPSEIDILRLMVSHVCDKFAEIESEKKKIWVYLTNFIKVVLFFGSIVVFFTLSIYLLTLKHPFVDTQSEWGKISEEWINNHKRCIDILKAGFGVTMMFCVTFLIYKYIFVKISDNDPYEKLKKLLKRCYTTSSTEHLNENNLGIKRWGANLSNRGSQKEVMNYPIASSKEIEYGLIEFLKKVEKKRVEFIFVFDELDKIEPSALNENYFEEVDTANESQGVYLQQIRDRKQAIINIITGLKNFLTTANARFIFIAGREMFDANLADVADRQSSIGSIFNYVFYVESFLKESPRDSLSGKVSMGSLIEKYMIEMLFGKDVFKTSEKSLYELVYEQCFQEKLKTGDKFSRDWIKGFCVENNLDETLFQRGLDDYKNDLQYQFMKTVVILQNFVNYLTYRSNGSPKKIIKTLHEFVRIREYHRFSVSDTIFIVESDLSQRGKETPYLMFSFKDQYRVGFINHLYRPFVIKYGESFKKYSDNIIISTTYLFDHLLKFHPFAFSFSNLEMIPEVLSTNKTPSLREHIITIIDYLSNNHLRETEVGIFDYKFYSRMVNELTYISKTFEEESAAFNFTLDEGYMVKLHIRKELKELRKIFDASQPGSKVFSITHLCGILGDLHFFDQEYDQAIVAYSNAIHGIGQESAFVSLTDFIVLIRFKLKLGLTFERLKNYDEALSFYANAAENSKFFISNWLENSNEGKALGISGEPKQGDKSVYYTSMLSDLLQIVNQSFIAKIVLQEKMGIEGITALKFGLAAGDFLKLSKNVEKQAGRNYLINSNLYLVLGNLLYFKNSNKGLAKDKELEENERKIFCEAYDEREFKKLFYLSENFKQLELEERAPVMAIFYYVIGLSEVIGSRFNEKESLNFLFKASSKTVRKFEQFTGRARTSKGNSKDFEVSYDHVILTGNIVNDILGYLKDKKILEQNIFSKTHNKYIAMFLSHIGDCVLSMIKANSSKDDSSIKCLLEEIFNVETIEKQKGNKKRFDSVTWFDDILNKNQSIALQVTDVLSCYYWSAQFFKKRGRMISYGYQLQKILYTLRLILSDVHEPRAKQKRNNRKSDYAGRELILKELESLLLIPVLNNASTTSEHSDRYMINKFDQLRAKLPNDNFNDSLYSSYIKNNIANHADTREALSLFMYIEIKQTPFKKIEFNKYKNFVNPYDSYATQYTRIFELGFWYKINKIKFHNRFPKAVKITQGGKLSADVELFEYAKEYIFTLFSQIHILEIYGLDYMVGHSFKAYLHYNIARFINKCLKARQEEFSQAVINRVKNHFGYNILGSLNDRYYHYSMAKMHYEKAKQLHTLGPEYIKNMDNIIYLEDDINDNAFHFGAALDRFLLTNGILDVLIGKCDLAIKRNNKPVYDLNAYL